MSDERTVDASLGEVAELSEIVDREALAHICRSAFDLFGISIRVFSASGNLLSDVHEEQRICSYVNKTEGGHAECAKTVAAAREVLPSGKMVLHPCFTGAVYRIVPIEYQGRAVGRFVMGPYLPSDQREVPKSLLVVDEAVESEEARRRLAQMPRVRIETAERIATHLTGIVELLLFSNHRARLTSEMHVASVRESYRELAEKTAQLQVAYDRLKELDRLKSNFLATVSHELRTPLTSIIGYSEMLTSGIGGELNEEQLEFIQTIHSKGDHLLALITSMLDMNKLEQGSLKLNRESLDPVALMKDVAKTLAPQANKKKVRVELVAEANLAPFSADPVRMRQVLFNLADNALKFTPEEGTVFLHVRSAEVNGTDDGGMGMILMAAPRKALEFAVQDTGIGIPPDAQARVFDAFYQVDGGNTRAHGGAGLGLSIAKRLVDAHEGQIRLESVSGEGTTFFVTIPQNVDDAW